MEELGAGQPLFSRRALAALYLPLVVEQLLVTTVGMADTVMVMRRGVILESAARDAFFSSPAHPYSRELVDAAM